MGSVFLDVGAAWDDTFNATRIVNPLTFQKEYDDLLISSGIGIRSYFLGLPVKVDIAWAKSYDNWSTPQYLFSLGYDFQGQQIKESRDRLNTTLKYSKPPMRKEAFEE